MDVRRGAAVRETLASGEFRNLWIAVLVSQLGDWVHLTALGWYVLESGGDAAGVTGVMAAGVLPQLFLTLAGGLAADRWPKRTVLRVIVWAQLVAAALFAFLVTAGTLSVWGLAAFAFLLGSFTAVWQPVYLSFLPDLVPEERLDNAMGLSLSALYTARTVGPAIAGGLIVLAGTKAAFFLNAATFLAPIIALASVRTAGSPSARRGSPIRGLLDSVRAVTEDPVLSPLWLVTAFLSLLALPCLALIPVYAQDVFGAGAAALGALMTSAGLGQLVGAVIVSLGVVDGFERTGLLQLLGYVIMGAFMLAFALAPGVAFGLAALFCFNLLHGLLSPRVNAIVQRRSAGGRGTAQSLFLIVFGLVPVGQLVLGQVAVAAGTVNAAAGFSLAFVAVAVWLLVGARGLREYSAGRSEASFDDVQRGPDARSEHLERVWEATE